MPVDLVLGLPPKERGLSSVEYVRELQKNLEEAYEIVRTRLKVVAERRSDKYALSIKPFEFKPGDKVFYYIPRRKIGQYAKWSCCYDGPYVVVEAVGKVNYRIRIMGGNKLFITHADKLKKSMAYEENPQETQRVVTVPNAVERSREEFETERCVGTGNSPRQKYVRIDGRPQHFIRVPRRYR